MISVSKNITLKPITEQDVSVLYQLMCKIYPAAYSFLWPDKGNWYIHKQYSKSNILKELKQLNTDYYFVLVDDEIVGNFRIVWDENLSNLQIENQVKLHRLYLDEKVQGKGVGKLLMLWLEKQAIAKKYNAIWLDAMDLKQQAFQFYKKLGYQYHSHIFLPFDLMFDEVRKMSQLYKKL